MAFCTASSFFGIGSPAVSASLLTLTLVPSPGELDDFAGSDDCKLDEVFLR